MITFQNRIPVTVQQVIDESPVVKRFVLAPSDPLTRLPRFAGGAHILTHLRVGDRELTRAYSLCSDGNDPRHYEIAIRRKSVEGSGSAIWHAHVKPGDRVDISPPRNHFALSPSARHHIFIAGGIGITPFLSMARDLRATGGSYELHYACKSPELCAFRDRISDEFPAATLYFSNRGRRPSPQLLTGRRVGTHVYICGPETMIESFAAAARRLGYPARNIHCERFAPRTAAESAPFTVQVRSSGDTFTVNADQSLLDALLARGYKVPYSCRAGGCGTCLVRVHDGIVDHRDDFLYEDEKARNDAIVTCVSRARSRLVVLDL